jgi:hypothetical protein
MGVKLLWVENSLLLRGVAMGEEELDGVKEAGRGVLCSKSHYSPSKSIR